MTGQLTKEDVALNVEHLQRSLGWALHLLSSVDDQRAVTTQPVITHTHTCTQSAPITSVLTLLLRRRTMAQDVSQRLVVAHNSKHVTRQQTSTSASQESGSAVYCNTIATYIFFSRVDFLCCLSFRYLFHPCVTAVARKKDPSHAAKSAGGRLQLNMHTPYVCGFAWSDMAHGCMVYTERAEMATVSYGTSHASAVSTPLRWIF